VPCDVSLVPRSPVPDPALAAALRRLREDRDLTQEALAYRAGITAGSYARIELGQSVPGWDTVRRVADALGVTLAELGTAVEKGAR
jgi:transcriptional regulator with XRE-family HTH domain